MYKIIGMIVENLLASGFTVLILIKYFKTLFCKKEYKKGRLFFIDYVLYMKNNSSLYNICFLSRNIFLKLLLLVFIKELNLVIASIVIHGISLKINLIFITTGIMFIVYYVFAALYIINQKEIVWMMVICVVVIIMVNIIVFILYKKLSENMELKHKNMIYEKEFELLDIHMKEKESTILEFNRKRHDFKHQMLGLLYLLKYKQYEQLEQNIMELADLKPLNNLKISCTDNYIVDAFVNYKYVIARKHGINFKAILDIPSQLPFADGDLCIILGNALDNALEANLHSKPDNPYIILKMKYDGNNLIIIIENSFDGNIKPKRRIGNITWKEDAINHGIGINSMKKIIKKYQGYYNVKVDGKVYCLNILLHTKTSHF